jgi:hypothetical protein
MDIDLGFGEYINSRKWNGKTNMSCRLFGLNAPELNTDAGKRSLAAAIMLLPIETECTVYSYGWDAYNRRWDGEIITDDGVNVNEALIASGNAVPKSY